MPAGRIVAAAVEKALLSLALDKLPHLILAASLARLRKARGAGHPGLSRRVFLDVPAVRIVGTADERTKSSPLSLEL